MIFDKEPRDWRELQSFVGQMFSECGFETEISKVTNLVRGQKEIDVYVRDVNSEYKPVILIECKHWSNPVHQEIVHSFRTVINDYGANMGYIVSKSGFQSGCYEAALNTSIKLVTLKDLQTEYLVKWKAGMVNKYMRYADRLFAYWDFPGKMPIDGGKIDWDAQQLVYNAYEPVCSLGPSDEFKTGFNRKYPIITPILNDKLEVIGEERIETDRQFFDFVEQNKDKALKHFQILYREFPTDS